MFTRIFPPIIVICVYLVHGASADTIVLTNGEKIEGRVLREEGDNYVLEVKVSGTIKDEQIIPKNEVKFIEEEKEDQKAFKLIVDLVPTPDLLSVENYEARIKVVSEFVEEHPTSGNVPKAKEMLDVLNEELEFVRDGGIKLDGELVPAEVYNSNSYELDAKISEKAINEAINRRDFLQALRLFTDYEKTFSDAAGRDDIASRISQVLMVYGARVDESLASFDFRMKKREAGLESMAADDRTKTERAIADEAERLEERFQMEKQDKTAWITPDANHKASLEEARRQIDREMSRIDSKSKKKPLDTPLAEAYRTAWTRLSGIEQEMKSFVDQEEEEVKVALKNLETEKKAIFDKLKTLRMPEVYVQKLRMHAGLSES